MSTLQPFTRLRLSTCVTLIAILSGLLPLTRVQAEDPPPPAKLRFLFLDEIPGTYSLKMGEEYRILTSSPYRVSPPITPPDLNRMVVFKNGPFRNPETGEFPKFPVAIINPPNNTTSSLVVITPIPKAQGESGGPKARVEYIDCDPGIVPAGSMRILNRGRAPLVAQIGADNFKVDVGKERIVSPDVDKRYRVRTRIVSTNGDGLQYIDDNVAIIPPAARVTGLMVFSPSGLRFRLGEDVIEKLGEPTPSHVWLTFTDSP